MLVASPRKMHGAVQAAFPPSSEDRRGRNLWRVDRLGKELVLYLVSPIQPDLSHLVEQAGWPTLPPTWRTAPYEPFLDRIREGDHYGFRLEANATHSVAEGAGRGKRFGHVTVAQQWSWLQSRAPRLGIDLGDASNPTGAVVERGVKTFSRGGSTVTLSTAVYSGSLKVVDAEALRDKMVAGIGPAKAYGCGLLTLAPVSS